MPDSTEDNKVLGIIVHRNFPEPSLVETTIRRGMMKHPGALWVCADNDKLTSAILEDLGLTYLTLGLNPYWKYTKDEQARDSRREVRDQELRRLCDELLVFVPTGSAAHKEWEGRHPLPQVHVIPRGKPKAKTTKRRKGTPRS